MVKLICIYCSKEFNFADGGQNVLFEVKFWPSSRDFSAVKVTFAPNLAKKLSSLFYYLILLFQLSVANPENFEEFKGIVR